MKEEESEEYDVQYRLSKDNNKINKDEFISHNTVQFFGNQFLLVNPTHWQLRD